jgi:hypothetical protein
MPPLDRVAKYHPRRRRVGEYVSFLSFLKPRISAGETEQLIAAKARVNTCTLGAFVINLCEVPNLSVDERNGLKSSNHSQMLHRLALRKLFACFDCQDMPYVSPVSALSQ